MDNQGLDDREKAYSITSDDEQPLSGDRKNPVLPKPQARIRMENPKTTVNQPAKPTEYSRDASDLDYRDRDPTRMNDDIRVMFEDVIAEPEGTHSFGAIWRVSFIVFTETKQWSYRILTAIFGVILGIVWGLLYALIAFAKIWLITPFFKMTSIVVRIFGDFWKLFVGIVLDPLFISVSKVFGSVNVAFNRKSNVEL